MLRASFSIAFLLAALTGFAQGTAFIYQGRLNDNGQPANGSYDLTFILYDSANQPGNIIAGVVTNAATKVAAGLFSASLDFGNAFDGTARWLEIGVRTNGAANFVTLTPRQPLTPVPYAIFAGATTNLVGPLSSANIAPVNSLIASSSNGLYSSLNSALGASSLATETNNGAMPTDYYIRGEWVAGQQEGVSRLPPLAIASYFGAFADTTWSNTTSGVKGMSNALWDANQTLRPFGYNYLVLDEGWASTNLDANNLLQLAPSTAAFFGTNSIGVSNFVYAIHTNGWKLGVYLVGGTNLSPGGFQHATGDPLLWTNASSLFRYGLDYLKIDDYAIENEQVAGILAANGLPVFLTGSAYPYGDTTLSSFYPAMFNSFRSVSGGDVTSYSQLLRWTDVAMTNDWWRWVGPGHFIDMDYIGGEEFNGGVPAVKTHLILCALFSSPIYDDVDFSPTSFFNSWFTNRDLLAINQDAAVICAQRYVQSNSCDVYVKPLGTPAGPQFALGVVNRSSLAPTNLTLYFTNLYPLLASGVQSWSAFDCVSNTGWVLQGANSFTVNLGANDSILWRLVPNYAVSTNIISVAFPDSVTMNVISNGVPFTFYGPWDTDASNYVVRAALTNQTEQLAAAVAVSLGKQHGWWAMLDALYLFRGANSNSCAQNLISPSYGVKWGTSGVTYDWRGVTGDGVAGYGDTQFTPSIAVGKYSSKSASLFVYNQTANPRVVGNFMGVRATTWVGFHVESPVVTIEGLNYANFGSAANWTLDAIGDARGPWFSSRLDANPQTGGFPGAYLQILYHGSVARDRDNNAATGLPTSSIYLLANNNAGSANLFQGCTLSAAGIGSGFTTAQYQTFVADLNTVEGMLRLKVP